MLEWVVKVVGWWFLPEDWAFTGTLTGLKSRGLKMVSQGIKTSAIAGDYMDLALE